MKAKNTPNLKGKFRLELFLTLLIFFPGTVGRFK